MKVYLLWCTHHKINYEQLEGIYKHKETALYYAKLFQENCNVEDRKYHTEEREISKFKMIL